MIIVCPLSKIGETVEKAEAERMITLINAGTPVPRPARISEANHLFVSVNDIWEPQDGMTLPGEAHVRTILDFANDWANDGDRKKPLVVHCFAGISRSTATAYTIAAALAPKRDEVELAQTLRRLSPSATPNPKIIALADAVLGRNGRMVRAIADIGRGADAFEGTPFMLEIGR